MPGQVSEFEIVGHFVGRVYLKGGLQGRGERPCKLLGPTRCCDSVGGVREPLDAPREGQQWQ
jgi:hypothetical protein